MTNLNSVSRWCLPLQTSTEAAVTHVNWLELRRHALPNDNAPNPALLPACWRARAVDLRAYGADSAATILERVADELDAALSSASGTLSLTEAARQSGYTADHIGRLIRNGTLPNAGRKHAPRVRSSDLPCKPAVATFSKSAIARAIASR